MLKAFFTNKTSNPTVVFLLFSLLALALRFFSFFPSVIDHDESTYLEIARMILAGKTLYIDMIDIKPPGIFFILAGFQAVFGHSIFVMRLLVSLWIALTAFMIYKTGRLLVKDERASLAAGIIYIFLISTWSFYGISITPEIFFNLFTISALYILLRKQSLLSYLLAGLLAGMGFMVKYLVVFDFAAFMIFFFFINLRKKEMNYRRMAAAVVIAGISFLLPFALMNLWYYQNGHFDALYNIVYLAPLKYPATFDPRKMLIFVLDFHLRFLPVLFFFYYAVTNKKPAGPENISSVKKLCILWSVMAMAAVLIAGKSFGHYMIQLMLPVSLMAGVFFHSGRVLPVFLQWLFKRKTGQIILVFFILLISMMKLEYYFRKDIPREVATYLEPRLKPGDVIYTGNYHHIIYYLLKKDSPTKYIHRTLLMGKNHIKALDINADEEFRNIMARQPVYIVIKNEYPVKMIRDFIKNNYILENDFGDGVLLYRLKHF